MDRLRFSAAAVLLAYSMNCAGLWAQATAQINGTVKDQTGAVLPGVEVSVAQTETGLTRSAVTNETGLYVLPNLPVGPYRLEATLPGFRTYVQTGIVLQINGNPTINAILEVGQVSDQIEVQADAALVETQSTGVGQVIDNQRVLELPLNGRQPQYLMFLAGAATTAPPGNLNSTKNYPTVVISVAGGGAAGLTYTLDGGTHNDPYSNQAFPLAFPDALQEFKVETSSLPAQYGQHSTAAVNAITKSGTNELHGDAFEFLRNGIFNARDFFAASRDTLKRNQFGGTIGGPIKRNKVFFFGGYQGTIQRSDPANGIAFIPTPAMIAGDFTDFASPACNGGRTLALKPPFAGTKVSPTLFSPAALNIMKYYPVTNDPCGKQTYGSISNSDEHLFVVKGDYQISDKHSLFTRYLGSHLFNPSPYNTGGNPLSLNNAGINAFVQSLVVGDTYLVTGNTVNSFRATASRGALDKFQNPAFGPKDVGINAYSYMKFFVLTAGTFITGSVFAHAGNYMSTTSQVADDVSIQKGNHQVGVGVNWIHSLNNNTINLNTAGQYTFNGTFTGTALGDFLTGQLSSMSQGNAALLYDRQHYVGLYAQDSWKMSPKLTMSYGLRWEPFLPVYLKRGRVSIIDPVGFNKDLHSAVYTNAPAGMIFPGDSGYPGTGVTAKQLAFFMPRLGLAWDPKGDGRMTVRAAYGMFYSTTHLFYDAQFAYESPWGNRIAQAGVKLDDPWSTYPGGNPFPLTIGKTDAFPVNAGYTSYGSKSKPSYVQQWNLSLQRQFGANWLISASYIGNNKIHGWAFNQINPGVYGPGATVGNIATRRAFYLQNPAQGKYFDSVALLDDGGTSSYQGGLFSVQRRLANNFTVIGNFTWSHCITDPIPNDSGGTYVVPDNRRADRGNCAGIDHRRMVNISSVYQTPQFAGRAMRLLASNWQISGIIRAETGPYITITSGVDNALTGQGSQRPNQVLGDPYAANKSVDGWLNAAAFVAAPTGTYGNMGINNVRAPGMFQLEMGLSRTLAIREGQKLQIRAEAFNLPNHLNPSTPTTSLNSPNFGKITSDITATGGLASGPGSGNPRIIQFALKYIF